MKRIAAFLVALLLVATCTVYVSAAGATATMSSATAERGDEVVLTVTLANAPATDNMGFELTVPAGLTLIEGQDTCWKTVAGLPDIIVSNKQGVWINTQPADNNGVVLSLAFEVEETASCGDNEIDIEFFIDDTAQKAENVTETAGVITVAHDWDEELTKTDAEGHYYACAGCDEKKDEAEHEFELSCDETCDICGYVRTGAEHDFSETYEKDGEKHWFECECGAKDSEAEHDYEYDCDDKCDTCGYVREAADHQPVGDVKYDDDGHWGECACGEQIDKTAHEFEYECSTECMHCEYTREADHDFSDMAVFSETEHWFECMYGCGEVDGKVEHTYDQEIEEDEYLFCEADCQTPTTYYKSCVCGYCDWNDENTFTVGEPDENAHEYIYDYETDSAQCYICEDVIEDLKGEGVEEIEGEGASITAPDGVLGENFEVKAEDVTDEWEDVDLGDVEEGLEGFGVVSYKNYSLEVSGAFAGLTEGMTVTVKIPGGRFKDIQLYNPESVFDVEDNGDGTITITVTENQLDQLGSHRIPVVFIGKPIASGTNDNGLTVLWIAVLAVAALGLVATAVYSKKRKATK